jgi:hypothetical protein
MSIVSLLLHIDFKPWRNNRSSSSSLLQRIIIHQSVLNAIARVSDPRCRAEDRHNLQVYLLLVWPDDGDERIIDRQSLEYLVDFLDNHRDSPQDVVITELGLYHELRLAEPSDGRVNVLTNLFSRSDTTLTKVALALHYFGSQQGATRILAAFHTNRTVTDLTIIRRIPNLEGGALGSCLASLLQNMPQLQRLVCRNGDLCVEGVRAFQPALQMNRTLKQLILANCALEKKVFVLLQMLWLGMRASKFWISDITPYIPVFMISHE